MKISQRVQNLKLSPIRKLAPYADAAKKAGKKVYHLNIGQPDIETPPQFMDAIKNFDEKVIAYGASKGEPFLIEAIQKYYAEKGMHYEAGDIFITNGGSEALTFAVMALCDPDDEIMVFEPFYANYTTFATEFGAKINAVTTSVENGYHLPDAAEIEKHITPKTKAILLTNPGNPTGVVYTEAEMQTIAALAVKHDLAVIADEVYREFVYGGEYKSFGTMPELDNNLIIIDSVSKRYSACGARIGLLISKNKEFMSQAMKWCQCRLCASTTDQVAAAALYSVDKDYFAATRDEYKRRRDTMVEKLSSIPGVIYAQPKGAFYIMAALPVDDADKFQLWLLNEFDDNGETVMFSCGEPFYGTPGKGKNEIRIAYVLKQEALERAMDLLRLGIEAYNNRK